MLLTSHFQVYSARQYKGNVFWLSNAFIWIEYHAINMTADGSVLVVSFIWPCLRILISTEHGIEATSIIKYQVTHCN